MALRFVLLVDQVFHGTELVLANQIVDSDKALGSYFFGDACRGFCNFDGVEEDSEEHSDNVLEL